MIMIKLQRDKNEYIIRFSKDDISDIFIQQFINKARIETLIAKSELTEQDVWEITEDAKESWWNNNHEWIMDLVNNSKQNENNN